MHIPSATTNTLSLLSFDDALRDALRPSQNYDVRRWLYVPNQYQEYRYLLGTHGENPLICIGINPSTAAPDALDNTLKSVERIAHTNGFDSFLMMNVYPQRATRPKDMEQDGNRFLQEENCRAFAYALQCAKDTPSVWAAWGNIVEMRDYLKPAMAKLVAVGQEAGAAWFCAGKRSKAGHPHHPLYLKKDSILEPFDMQAYLETL